MPRGRPKSAACHNCRWWERSGNFRNRERDWGDCHFWGGREGIKIVGRKGGAMIDRWVGASPRGSDKCSAYNADPEMRGKIDPRNGPARPRGDED